MIPIICPKIPSIENNGRPSSPCSQSGKKKNKNKKVVKEKEINASVPISGALDLIFSLRETLSKLELLLLGPFWFFVVDWPPLAVAFSYLSAIYTRNYKIIRHLAAAGKTFNFEFFKNQSLS
jgi:hypothetical protein